MPNDEFVLPEGVSGNPGRDVDSKRTWACARYRVHTMAAEALAHDQGKGVTASRTEDINNPELLATAVFVPTAWTSQIDRVQTTGTTSLVRIDAARCCAHNLDPFS